MKTFHDYFVVFYIINSIVVVCLFHVYPFGLLHIPFSYIDLPLVTLHFHFSFLQAIQFSFCLFLKSGYFPLLFPVTQVSPILLSVSFSPIPCSILFPIHFQNLPNQLHIFPFLTPHSSKSRTISLFSSTRFRASSFHFKLLSSS